MLTSSNHLLYAGVISFFSTRKCQKFRKINENNYYWWKISSYLLNDFRKFNEIFRKDVAYDNIESHKKQGFILSPENTILEKAQGGGGGGEGGCHFGGGGVSAFLGLMQ